jgi:hypothetical protein
MSVTSQTDLYHRRLGIPDWMKQQVPQQIQITYSEHAIEKSRGGEGIEKYLADEDVNNSEFKIVLPNSVVIEDPDTIIELEYNHKTNQVEKFLVRTEEYQVVNSENRLHYYMYDLVLAIIPDGTLKTIYLNKAGDDHATLNRSRYSDPEEVSMKKSA